MRSSGSGGIAGLDYGPILEMAKIEDLDMKSFTYLLPMAEGGIVSAFQERENRDKQ